MNCIKNYTNSGWKFVNGYKGNGQSMGNYSIKGLYSHIIFPCSREKSIGFRSNIDFNTFWIFSGIGDLNSYGYLNDLWRYNIEINKWMYVSGDDKVNNNGVYGNLGEFDDSLFIGSRCGSVGFITKDFLFSFGGKGFGNGEYGPYLLNDLWSFNISNNQWGFISGTDENEKNGNYGEFGESSANFYPGGRENSVGVYSVNIFYLFGGNGFNHLSKGKLNDLWTYNVLNGNWSWISCSKNLNQQGEYGERGNYDELNCPGSRESSSMFLVSNQQILLFGGSGNDNTSSNGYLCDLWSFNITTMLWSHIAGSKSIEQYGIYDFKDSYGGRPGGRYGHFSFWNGKEVKIFGGAGYDEDLEISLFNDYCMSKYKVITIYIGSYNMSINKFKYIEGGLDKPSIYGVTGRYNSSIYHVPGGRNNFIGLGNYPKYNIEMILFGGYSIPYERKNELFFKGFEHVFICKNEKFYSIDYYWEDVCSGNGECKENVTDYCQCQNSNYTGEDCEIFKCFSILNYLNSVCFGHGECIKHDKCLCKENYIGLECEIWNCFDIKENNENVCSSHGSCSSYNNCTCFDKNYTGIECEKWDCFGKSNNDSLVCSGNGNCTDTDICYCPNYKGLKCEEWTCGSFLKNSSLTTCSSHGICIDFDTCDCFNNYTGKFCEEWMCYDKQRSNKEVCSKYGECVDINNCSCSSNYTGVECGNFSCFYTPNYDSSGCNYHGDCIGHDNCSCWNGYFGEKCDKWDCYYTQMSSKETCSSHGQCIDYDKVRFIDNTSKHYESSCSTGYGGKNCEIWKCYGIQENNDSSCNNHGICKNLDECICSNGWSGEECDFKERSNFVTSILVIIPLLLIAVIVFTLVWIGIFLFGIWKKRVKVVKYDIQDEVKNHIIEQIKNSKKGGFGCVFQYDSKLITDFDNRLSEFLTINQRLRMNQEIYDSLKYLEKENKSLSYNEFLSKINLLVKSVHFQKCPTSYKLLFKTFKDSFQKEFSCEMLTCDYIAVKLIKYSNFEVEMEKETEERLQKENYENVKKEIKILSKTSGEGDAFLKFYGYSEFKIEGKGKYIAIFIEWFADILSYVDDSESDKLLKEDLELSWDDKIDILKYTAEGIEKLHSLGIVHLDLKWENVLSNGKKFKIIDFGTSHIIKDNKSNPFKCLQNDKEFIPRSFSPDNEPPEIISRFPGDITTSSPLDSDLPVILRKIDVYQFGVMMYKMISNKRCSFGDCVDYRSTSRKMIVEGVRPNFERTGNPERDWIFDLINECWNQEPEKRKEMNDIRIILSNKSIKKEINNSKEGGRGYDESRKTAYFNFDSVV